MDEKLEAQNLDSVSCEWCGKKFSSDNLVRQQVCLRCHKLLKGANLTDEEIFSGKDSRISKLSIKVEDGNNV